MLDKKEFDKSTDIDGLYFKGLNLMNQGRVREAIPAWQKVVTLIPENAVAQYNLGSLFIQDGKPQQAAACYQKAVELDPYHAQAWCNLGVALRHIGQFDAALNALRKSLDLNPNSAVTYANLAECYEAENRTAASEQAAKEALTIDPNQSVAKLMLIRLYYRNDRLLEAQRLLKEILQNELPPHQRARALNQYGQVLEKLGNPEQAYQAFVEGQKILSLQPESQNIDPSRYLYLLDNIQSWVKNRVLCNPTQERQKMKRTDHDRRIPQSPIFLVGFPRSGTTLTEQILSSHPALVSSDERPLIDVVMQALKRANQHDETWTSVADQPDTVDWDALRQIYWQAARQYADYHANHGRFIDKLPLNIIHLGLIERLFPNAPIVVLIRDPRDACLSAFQQEFIPNDAMIHFTSFESTVNIYQKVMSIWLAQRSLLTLSWLEIRYEDLVTEMEKTIHRIINFLNIPFDPIVLRFYETTRRRHISTPSYHAVTKPVYRSSVGRWRPYAPVISKFFSGLTPFLNEFHYLDS